MNEDDIKNAQSMNTNRQDKYPKFLHLILVFVAILATFLTFPIFRTDQFLNPFALLAPIALFLFPALIAYSLRKILFLSKKLLFFLVIVLVVMPFFIPSLISFIVETWILILLSIIICLIRIKTSESTGVRILAWIIFISACFTIFISYLFIRPILGQEFHLYLSDKAIDTHNIKVCHPSGGLYYFYILFTVGYEEEECKLRFIYGDHTLDYKNINIEGLFRDDRNRDNIYEFFAQETFNVDLCQKINSDFQRKRCFDNVSTYVSQ